MEAAQAAERFGTVQELAAWVTGCVAALERVCAAPSGVATTALGSRASRSVALAVVSRWQNRQQTGGALKVARSGLVGVEDSAGALVQVVTGAGLPKFAAPVQFGLVAWLAVERLGVGGPNSSVALHATGINVLKPIRTIPETFARKASKVEVAWRETIPAEVWSSWAAWVAWAGTQKVAL